MADHLAVTIPLKDIQRIQIYLNTGRKSLAAIQKETGADYIINGTLYNMETFKPNCHLRADGRTICTPAYDVAGYAWNDGTDISIDTLPDPTQRNYIACTPLVLDGKPIANLTYDPGQGGKRGRTAMGIKGDRLALYCTRDGGTMERTPETLRDDLAAAGWESAVMMDGGGSSQCYFKGDTIKSTRVVHDLILVYLKGSDTTGVKTYSVKKDGSTYLSKNFKVSEFKCNDGSDTVLISDKLVDLLQNIRDHFGVAVTINSAYRTESYNKKIGGATKSQHVNGTAADIVVKGATPLEVAQYVEHIMPGSGGIGVYQSFTHVDVRASRIRWDNRSGKEVVVPGWPGYQEETMSETDKAVQWVQDVGIMAGNSSGDMMLDDKPTRRQIAIMLYRFAKWLGKI